MVYTINSVGFKVLNPGYTEENLYYFAGAVVCFYLLRSLVIYLFSGVPRKYIDIKKRH